MYKLLLSLRYLRTRWIALASIISVTLGVATLIVVNSVMSGFRTEMMDRVKGVLADVIIKGGGLSGFPDCTFHMRRIEQTVGDKIEAMTPVVETPGLLTFEVKGRSIPQPVLVRGIDMGTYAKVGKFNQYIHEAELRANPSFEVSGKLKRSSEWWRGIKDEEPSDELGESMPDAPSGETAPSPVKLGSPLATEQSGDASSGSAATNSTGDKYHRDDPFKDGPLAETTPVASRDRGVIVPWLMATYRLDGEDYDVIRPGQDVLLTLPAASVGTTFKVEGRHAQFTTVGRFRSGMSEYDSAHCYVDIRDLQELRGMRDHVTAIEIKLKNYADAPEVIRRLTAIFPPGFFMVRTWEDEQKPLLTAVQMEQGILNVLLFMIIAVAGFGILAIFFMIVVEKTRDIGILKSLGASDAGVMQIFLSYGLSLGIVGSGLGMLIGLAIVVWLDRIERLLSWLCGHDVFDRDLYYFDKIPTVISWFDIGWIVAGAMAIAVVASVLPARRAATLRPVQALRYE